MLITLVDNSTISNYSDSVTEREPPRPKPRQRTMGLSLNVTEKIEEDAESQDASRPQTSSASIPLSTDTSSNITKASSPHVCLTAWLFNILRFFFCGDFLIGEHICYVVAS